MSRDSIKNDSVSILLLGIFVLLASFDSVYKYGGWIGLAAYVPLGFLWIYLSTTYIWPALEGVLTESAAAYLAVLLFAGLLAYVLVIYPLANNGYFGPGSDANDALIIGATEFLHGRYPYYAITYLGNPIAPLPGTMLIAIPFVLFDRLDVQNLFWLVVFFFVLRAEFKSTVKALLFSATILVVTPTIFQNLATGTDHIANANYILLAVWLMIRRIPDPSASLISKLAPTLLLGIGLSSRSNFFFLLPLLVTCLALRTNWKSALIYGVVACVATSAVTLPFYLYDPAHFTPLNVQTEKLIQFNGIVPKAGVVFAITAGMLAFALAFRLRREDDSGFFRSCAVVQLYSVIYPSVLFSILHGEVNFYFGHVGYGLFFLFFGSFGELIRIDRPRSVPT